MASSLRHFPARHWQGRIALLPTVLLTLLGLRLGLDALAAQRPPGWPMSLLLGFSAASALVLVWQVVGGLRAIARHGRDLFAAVAGLLAVLATVTLWLNGEITLWAARAAPPLDLPGPPAPLPVSAAGVLRLDGPITLHRLARFEATLAQPDRGGLRLVELESEGGHVPAARGLARRISEAGLDTRVTGLCASACTLVFMGGVRRSLAPGARLGFHGYSLSGYDTPLRHLPEEEARDRAWLSARGVAPAFIARAFATPHETLWQPTRAELRAAGLLAP